MTATLNQVIANEADRCVGCGDLTQPGDRRTLANFNVLLNTWRGIFREKLNELSLEIDECNVPGRSGDASTNKGFICTKCKRTFESYELTKKKLLNNVSNALKYITTSPCSRKRPRQDSEGDFDGTVNENPPPAKRAFQHVVPSMSSSSPDVQVGDLLLLLLLYFEAE